MMLPQPHGGSLVCQVAHAHRAGRAAADLHRLPTLELTPRQAYDAVNLATGVFSPLRSFMGRDEVNSVARGVYGTDDPGHPGVAALRDMAPVTVAGPVELLAFPEHPYARYALTPRESRVLFAAKGWRTLAFVDGTFINPVIGRKKGGDFKDEVILLAYEALTRHYFLRNRSVLAVLLTEMRYAGAREAVFHAIIRKNFGCTHFIVGRDRAGVGDFYGPYAAHEIFDRYPDLGIVPLFLTAFFCCRRCGGVASEKTCRHGPDFRVDFSGTRLRAALARDDEEARLLARPQG